MNQVMIRRFVSLIGLLVFAGCSAQQTKETTKELPKNSLVWQEDRKKSFGIHEYKALTSEEEAEQLVTDKFQVVVPTFFKEGETFIKAAEIVKTYPVQTTTYDVLANQESLTYTRTTLYSQEGQNPVFRATVQVVYVVNSERQEVITSEQKVIFTISPTEETIFYDGLPTLSQQMGKLIDLNSSKETLQKKFQDIPAQDSQRAIEAVTILSVPADSSGVSKAIQVYYDGNGKLTEWQTSVMYE